MKVGFIGLGTMGASMASNLQKAQVKLVVHDIRKESAKQHIADGAEWADTPKALAEQCEVIFTSLPGPVEVEAVALGKDGLLAGMKKGSAYFDLSTNSPTVIRRIEKEFAKKGVFLLDAPVSGGPVGAAEGTLAIMVGGEQRDLEQCRDALSLMGSRVLHAGPVGAGTAMKLARNLIHFVSFTAVTEAQRLAEAAGVDLQALGEVVRHTDAITGGPGAIMHRETAAPPAPDDAWRPIFDHVRTLGEKDLRFAADLAEQLAVETPLARLAHERLGPGLGLTEEG